MKNEEINHLIRGTLRTPPREMILELLIKLTLFWTLVKEERKEEK